MKNPNFIRKLTDRLIAHGMLDFIPVTYRGHQVECGSLGLISYWDLIFALDQLDEMEKTGALEKEMVKKAASYLLGREVEL